jgi:hypothetical protein
MLGKYSTIELYSQPIHLFGLYLVILNKTEVEKRLFLLNKVRTLKLCNTEVQTQK